MTLAEAGEIFGYWDENPPAHLMLQTIARMLGWAPRPISAAAARGEEIAAATPPGLVVASAGERVMPVPLNLDALRAANQARALAIARRNRDAGSA